MVPSASAESLMVIRRDLPQECSATAGSSLVEGVVQHDDVDLRVWDRDGDGPGSTWPHLPSCFSARL